jgi:4-aminobutyrate aminotransferase-like enzyme
MPDPNILARRLRALGSSPLFYAEPLTLVRGDGVYLYGDDGRRYLDCYNNIPCVGHCNQRVVDAIARQASTLNVHSRYVSDIVVNYAERLLGSFDTKFDQVMFTCSGSEANDQALRIARLLAPGRGIICTNFAYHGNTAAVDEISPLFHHAPQHFAEVRTITYPEMYRPLRGLSGEVLNQAYLNEMQAAIDSFDEAGIGFAGFIFCSVFANEGLPAIPPGLLAAASALVRRAGGFVISDEVQAGFGRTGKMWGHQLMGFTPDIVTMGKPMGNGYPVAALVSRADILDAYRAKVFYFNTFAGAQVAVAAAGAVLDEIEDRGLMDNARRVGDYIRAGFARLAKRFELIGDIRGAGLWIGVEMVRDRQTRAPAPDEALRLVNLLKDAGCLTGRIGEHDNVLKIRPPLVCGIEHADELLGAVESSLEKLQASP